MKKPTIEELEKLLYEAFGTSNSRSWYSIFAKTVHEMFNPPLKPLSELHKDREACEKIANELGIKGHHSDLWGTTVKIFGDIDAHTCTLSIGEDGLMDFDVEGDYIEDYNTFKLTKLILSLGYDVQPETKTT